MDKISVAQTGKFFFLISYLWIVPVADIHNTGSLFLLKISDKAGLEQRGLEKNVILISAAR